MIETLTEVCTLEELERAHVKVVSAGGWPIAVFHDNGAVYAMDNRCPHMGFPLHRGTIRDGILTCHWHHAKFDLCGGCTFDPFADDVTTFRTEVRDGVVYVDPRPVQEDRLVHWRRKLTEGLEQQIDLVVAKSVIGLCELGAAKDVLEAATLFGVRNRASGWSQGLTILAAMANILPSLDAPDHALALYQGVIHVAASTAGQPPSFQLDPLESAEADARRFLTWFRHFAETRADEAAERTLRTAVHAGLDERSVAEMVFAACTDHLYMDVGHALDFANKAFEMLDHIGWARADEVLPSLVAGLVSARRMEESSSWRHPVDLAELLADATGELPSRIDEGAGRRREWTGHRELAETILDATPAETLSELLRLIGSGVALTELSSTVAYAGALRSAYFSVSNEFADWDTVHHTFTYANAVDQAMRRAPSKLLARGILDSAMAVYLERFLNVPKRPIPAPSGGSPSRRDILAAFDQQGRVDETGQLVVDAAAAGHREELLGTLGHALLREDAGFHAFQIYEAGLRQYRQFEGRPEADHILVGMARFLTAHAPTVRAVGQTFDIAARLHRRETLYEDVD
jgi:nitrite reductase/ring-hydroxylating ferredoxin subunit